MNDIKLKLEEIVQQIYNSNKFEKNRKDRVMRNTINRITKRKKLMEKHTVEELTNIVNKELMNCIIEGIPTIQLNGKEIKYNQIALSNAISNTIIINTSLLYDIIDKQDFYSTASTIETKYLKKNIKNENNYLYWVIAHEVCHIEYPEFRHSKKFSEKVEEIFLNTKQNK